MYPDHIQMPQELVNHIIDFLHDTPTDLKACALVSRAFVYEAQSHIFKELSIGNFGAMKSDIDALWSRCQATMHASPHLVQHIHRFELYPRPMSTDTLSTICTFPFTHLKEIRISPVILSHSIAIALQQLFGLPTLRFVRLHCSFNSPSTLIEIWDRCPPGLKHLELGCSHLSSQTSTEAFHPTPPRRPAPIRLDSLRIMAPVMGLRDWMDHPLCPFDFSGLRVVSISDRIEVLRWSKIIPALRTVEVLDFAVFGPDTRIDLSSCLDLAFLRISVNGYYDWPMVLNTVLSTIAPSNHIRKIVISGVFTDGIAAEELDAGLSSLPMHHLPAFHFEMDPDESGSSVAPSVIAMIGFMRVLLLVRRNSIAIHSPFNLVLKNPHIDLSLTCLSNLGSSRYIHCKDPKRADEKKELMPTPNGGGPSQTGASLMLPTAKVLLFLGISGEAELKQKAVPTE
ncbi:hypothetical protein DFH09DRAFT_1095478 [Mycena vulgaris]|nr:hypothetical protein DFH09DRAFT_1095478 [Mycena vulgaris]